MNRNVFFEYVRKAPFGGRLTQSQVDGLTKILDEWDRRKLKDIRWLAYKLATTFHETNATIQPVREMGGETGPPDVSWPAKAVQCDESQGLGGLIPQGSLLHRA